MPLIIEPSTIYHTTKSSKGQKKYYKRTSASNSVKAQPHSMLSVHLLQKVRVSLEPQGNFNYLTDKLRLAYMHLY